MIDWLTIGKGFSKNDMACRFEKLAFAYVQDVYSEYDWEATPLSGDGNKDAHIGKGAEFDVWEEAKYKGFHSKSGRQYTVRRQDLDTTILSGLQQGNVRLIVFVSNSVIPPELYERVAFSSKLKGIEVTYILRAQLESWIYRHKEIFKKIFEVEPTLEYENEQEMFNIDSVGIFDMHHANFLEVTQVKELVIRERYVLQVMISSSIHTRATIQNSVFDILDHPDFTQSTFDLSPGINRLLFLISPITKHCNRVNLRFLINKKEFNAYSPEVIIEENGFPSLIYSNQLEIISNIKNVIDNRAQDSAGIVVSVFGCSGMGKSYILKSLHAEYLFRHESLYVDFDANEMGGLNESYLCRIIIFLNYGNVFLYNSLNTKADATKLKRMLSHFTTYSDITATLRNRLIDGCWNYAAAISVIQELSNQFKGSIVPTAKFKLCRLLFIDDVQNLNETQFELISHIVSQIDKYKTNILFVLSATQDAFKSEKMRDAYLTLTSNKFKLNGLNKTDKKLTLTNHFTKFSALDNSISDIILPSSPLLAAEILLSIMREPRNASLYEIVATYNINNENCILTNKFSKFESMYYLLDILCLFKLGIGINYLINYPDFLESELRNNISVLLHAGILIKISENKISFSHDMYNQSYQKLRNGRQYNSEVGLFLKYWYEKTTDANIDKNILLSNLIRCGESYLKEYKDIVFDIISLNARSTNFNVALYYCEYYFKMLIGNCHTVLSEKERYILYLYSDCLVHCGQGGEAERIFEQILDITEEDTLEYLEIRVSLLNQWFWAIQKLDRLISDSLLLQRKTELFMKNTPYSEVSFRLKKCESSCYNRRMATQLLLDMYDDALATYINWLMKTAQRVSGDEYKDETAVLIMDYARGISYRDIKSAERLMTFAYYNMSVMPERNFRRLLICKIDLLLLNHMNGKEIDIREFKNTTRILGKSNFKSECFKAVLKYYAMKLIGENTWLLLQKIDAPNSSSLEETNKNVHQCMLKLKIIPQRREKYLYNILMAFVHIKENNIDNAREELQEALGFVEPAGKSYSEALLHNLQYLNSINKIAWYWRGIAMKEDTYYLDCRFW